MFLISNIKYFFLFFLFYACQTKIDSININNKQLALVDSTMLYKEKPFSGMLFSKIDTLTNYKAAYINGKKHGKEQKFFFNGHLAELRFYNQGKKKGIHQSWWNKKQLKSEYHFDDDGNYIGTQREWHANGQLHKEFNYTKGNEDGKQKSWDFTGKISANYEVINGERFGLISSNKCKPDTYVD